MPTPKPTPATPESGSAPWIRLLLITLAALLAAAPLALAGQTCQPWEPGTAQQRGAACRT